MEWWTVSNAVDNSIKIPRVKCFSSKESKVLSTNSTVV